MPISRNLANILMLSAAIFTVGNAKNVDYRVIPGDTLYIIAKKHHTTVKELKQTSGLTSGDVLKVGQKIIVPVDTYFPDKNSSSTSIMAISKKNTYKVQKGDTLYTIAKKTSTPTNVIRKANNMKDGQLISVGQTLKIPNSLNTVIIPARNSKDSSISIRKNTKNLKPVKYIVVSGDTLYSIARRYKTTPSNIRKLSGMSKQQLIRVGQELTVSKIVVPAKTKLITKKTTQTKATTTIKSITNGKKQTTINSQQVTQNASKTSGTIKYKVQSGDALSLIAKKYNISTKELMIANSLASASSIRIGQVLNIPTKSSPEPKTSIAKTKNIKQKITAKPIKQSKIYTVKQKDTLYSIAKKNKISLRQLLDLNGMHGNYSIKIGQRLILGEVTKLASANTATSKVKSSVSKQTKPQLTASKTNATVDKLTKYRIKKGDVISVIAKRNNIDLDELLKLNKMSKRTKLRIGQIIVLNKSKNAKSVKSNKRIASARNILKNKKTKRARTYRKPKKIRGSNANVIRTAKRYLGRRYVWGATGPSKFDCSGFTQYVLRKSKGVRIPRVSRQQAYYGKYVSRRNLRAGDLIFFDTSHRRRGYVNHVGIYIGNNQFIHASSARHRVVITSLNRPFYRARFKWGRRVN